MTPPPDELRKSANPKRGWFVLNEHGDVVLWSGRILGGLSKSVVAIELVESWESLEARGFTLAQFDLVPVVPKSRRKK